MDLRSDFSIWICSIISASGPRHLTCYFSGITGMGYKKYLLISGLGAFAWCLIFITLGYFVGLHA
ncbi:VTT domain-containing protein [Paenibacillus profundus]|uniref:VTT domain-containing protein n=1 Tax=Paenibacillus profundus TaxID=1173085 RepID=A0ABS8YPT7_9BACL|nr:VTT domain-containing protein [Paenibacillus profundus]MCE5172350.1 VTT domain-containing protein [Paenibacillus profundus]